jgi:hypothetical protein
LYHEGKYCFQHFSDLDEMDYEDEFDDAEDVNRRFQLNDTKTFSTFSDSKIRNPADDTLMTMSYKGAQVRITTNVLRHPKS